MSFEKEDLISIVYHDLRGKIGNIMNISDLMINKVDLNENERSDLAPTIKSSATEIFQMIELLRFLHLHDSNPEFGGVNLNPFKELESISEKLRNLLHSLGLKIEYSAEDFPINLKINLHDFKYSIFLLVYILINEVENADALKINFDSGEENADLRVDIINRNFSGNELHAENLENFLHFGDSKVNKNIYYYWLRVLENNSIGLKVFKHDEFLSSVILKYRVK